MKNNIFEAYNIHRSNIYMDDVLPVTTVLLVGFTNLLSPNFWILGQTL